MVNKIQTALQDAVARAFPGLPGTIILRPLLDFRRGHLGTDICQQVASLRKESPASIAETLVPLLPDLDGAQVVFDEGFLNVRLTGNGWRLLEGTDWPGESHTHTILLSPHPDTVPAGDYLRLLSFACVQALHLLRDSKNVVLQIAGQRHEFNDIQSVLTGYVTEAHRILTAPCGVVSQEDAARSLIEQLSAAGRGQTTLWLTPRSLTRKRYSELFKNSLDAHTQIQCPSLGMVSGMDTDGLAVVIADVPLESLLYVSSGVAASDLDWLVPRSGEGSNCIWFARVLVERACQLGLDLAAADEVESVVLASEEGSVVVQAAARAALMPAFSHFAGGCGAVIEWRQSFDDLLAGANRLLNSPRVRMAIASGDICLNERKIITGVLKSVSDMMNLWKLN